MLAIKTLTGLDIDEESKKRDFFLVFRKFFTRTQAKRTWNLVTSLFIYWFPDNLTQADEGN